MDHTTDGAQPQGFFAVDARAWAWVCQHGINAAVGYLILGRGTGPDNRTTSWSVNAIEAYTGISRQKAHAAIERLKNIGAIKQIKDGTKPSYYIVPAHEIVTRQPLSDYENCIVSEVKRNTRVWGKRDIQAARSAVEKGWLVDELDGEFSLAPEPKPEPDWIWLPNALVTGAGNEIPPVELLRQTQDVMVLRLLVDFYGTQNLCEDGGVGRRFTWQSYERVEVGQQGQYTVFGFRYKRTSMYWCGPSICHRRKVTAEEKAGGINEAADFWRRLDQLVALGLVQWVPHLFESGGDDAEIVHPYGMGATDSIEDRIGTAAHEAGRRLLTDSQVEWAADQKLRLIPVPAHIAEAQLIGIARLRYRPHTSMTAAWQAKLIEAGDRVLDRFGQLGASAAARAA